MRVLQRSYSSVINVATDTDKDHYFKQENNGSEEEIQNTKYMKNRTWRSQLFFFFIDF